MPSLLAVAAIFFQKIIYEQNWIPQEKNKPKTNQSEDCPLASTSARN